MSEDEDFHVITFVGRRHTVVMLSGDVDASIYATFRAVALAAIATTDHVTFDVAGVTFMDAAGLSVIVEIFKRMTARGGTVSIHGARRPVSRLLQITGFDNLVTNFGPLQHDLGPRGICRRRPHGVRTFAARR